MYLDDVIVFSQSLQAHLEHLKKVFDCLEDANLKLNHKKCRYMSEEVEYLGHVVTPRGLKPNMRNLDAVRGFPIPNNVKQQVTNKQSTDRKPAKKPKELSHKYNLRRRM